MRRSPAKNWTSPLQTERRRHLLFGGKPQLFQPLSDAAMAIGALGFECGSQLRMSQLPARKHKQAQRNPVLERRRGNG